MKLINLTSKEKKAIEIWTSADLHQYRSLKSIIRGDYDGGLLGYYEKYALALVGLFEKYDDNTQEKILYRGDVLDDGYENFLKNNTIGKCIILEDSILSFTLSKDIAIKSYTNSDKNKNGEASTILYVLQKRNSTFLDISAYSKLPHEKEVLCNKSIQFKIVDIEKKESTHLVCFIEECLTDD